MNCKMKVTKINTYKNRGETIVDIVLSMKGQSVTVSAPLYGPAPKLGDVYEVRIGKPR